MTRDRFRRIALGLPGAAEGAHMGHPDFRTNGKIFATLSPDGHKGMVKLTPEQQKTFMAADADVFTPASGAWGRQGCTMVVLDRLDEEVLGEAMTLAWQNATQARPAGARRVRRPAQPARKARAARRR
jgi:hypothetical protein